MLIELGPVSQDKAVTACGYEGGSTVVTFDNKGDDQVLRNYFWDKYQERMLLNPAYLQQSGFWTGYVRFFGDVSNPYINLYTGSPMNTSFFAPRQPDDRILGAKGGEACVCRKEFSMEELSWDRGKGLDDYTCSFPNWVICRHRNVYALNLEAWNSALMYGVQLPEDGTCRLDWKNQNYYQLTAMKEKRLRKGYPGAQELVDHYEEILRTDAIKSPNCTKQNLER
ncbi:uncharacterized protein LOC134840187 isoform X2 [Symsagittifera roscoffensis]